jgi:DNA invertase Pin-like site-specific DNA recombinase
MICPHCERDSKLTRKENAALKLRNTFYEKQNRGEHVGRPRKRDDKKINRLRAQGYSMREIVKMTGTSIAQVYNSIREARTK